MRTDIPAAALRLLCSLPVRTHERLEPVRKSYKPSAAEIDRIKPKRKRIKTGKGRGGLNRRAFMLDGKLFESVKACRSARKVGNAKIKYWFCIGRARYV